MWVDVSVEKIAIIGSGIAGLLLARSLLRGGYEVVLFEEDASIGKPPHCTGIISEYTSRLIGEEAFSSAERFFDELVFQDLDTNSVFRLRTRERVVRVDRVALERLLADSVKDLGGEILLKCKIDNINKNKLKLYSKSCNNIKNKYDLIIVAGGYKSRYLGSERQAWDASRSFGFNLGLSCPKPILNRVEDAVSILVSSAWSGVYYGWLFPVNDESLVIGAEGPNSNNVINFIKYIIKKFNIKKCLISERYGGLVLHGPPRKQMKRSRLFYTGDAAGLTKPLTGGGLFPNSLLASYIEKDTLDEISNLFIKNYKKIYKMLHRQYPFARAILESNGLPTLVRIASRIFSGGEIDGIIDYDRHEKLVSSIVRRVPIKSLKAVARLVVDNPGLVLKLFAGMVVWGI